MKNITFLLSHIPDPRINKRIAIAKTCANVVVICVRRTSQYMWTPVHNDVKHIIINMDLPSTKHLIKRYFASKQYTKCALESLLDISPDLIYADGFDSLMIANKYKKIKKNVKVFFEVADIRECFIQSSQSITGKIITRILNQVEKVNLTDIDCLVITSMRFYDMHYKYFVNKNNILFIPNMPDPMPFKKYIKKNSGNFTVGFIGGIRYLDQMKMLVNAAGNVGCDVLFAGAGGTVCEYNEIFKYCANKAYVTLYGKYDYDKEIAKLYGMVDCIYAIYDADNPNVKIALPNKLYESIYCELPILVAKETYLAEVVTQHAVGIAVPHKCQSELEKTLYQLRSNQNYYNHFVNACKLYKPQINIAKYNELLLRKFKTIYGNIY